MNNHRNRRERIGIIFILLFFMLTIMTASAAMEETIHKIFTVNSGGLLTVETKIGSIEVVGKRGDTVEINIFQNVRNASERITQDILDDFQVSCDQKGDDVFVKAEFRRNGFPGFFSRMANRLQVRFIITVPQEYDVDLDTAGGKISVQDLVGRVSSRTSGGSLTFENITGDIAGKTSGGGIRVGVVRGEVVAHTSGGSIKIERAEGDIDVETSGGSITIDEAGGTVRASTSGGSVSAFLSHQPDQDCRLTTSGGSITVYLDDEIGLDVDAHTSGGRIHTDFPVRLSGTINPRSLNAEVNGGGPELYLRSSGGSIYLRKK